MPGINYLLNTAIPYPSGLNLLSNVCLPVGQVPWGSAVIAALLPPVIIQNISAKAAKVKAVAPVA